MQKNIPLPLTPKEKNVLDFIESYFIKHTVSPTFSEIKDHFGFASFNSVQRYLKQLQKKKYIFIPGGNQKRALQLLHPSDTIVTSFQKNKDKPSTQFEDSYENLSLMIPLLGKVAAGQPLESKAYNENVEVPRSLVRKPSSSFALKVHGQSMIEEGILDGDTILVQKQAHASNGEIIVATVDNEATVKRFYLHSKSSHSKDFPMIELRPANSTMDSLWYPVNKVKIEGIVVGLIRKF
ncbi:MAG: transcriptional repressor LexA [Bdellovibrionales bacterium]|nr:transcriptional repressor LexA [Bdellovibrionales bacterium]